MTPLRGRRGQLQVDGRAHGEELGSPADHDHGQVVGPGGWHDRGQAFRDAEHQRPDQELRPAGIPAPGRVVVPGDPADGHERAEQAEADRAEMEDPRSHQRVGDRELQPEAAEQQRHRGRRLNTARQVKHPAEAPGRNHGTVRYRCVPGTPRQQRHDHDHSQERRGVREEHGGLAGRRDDDPGHARPDDLGQAGDRGVDGGSAAQFGAADEIQHERLPGRDVDGLDAADGERRAAPIPDGHPASEQRNPDSQ